MPFPSPTGRKGRNPTGRDGPRRGRRGAPGTDSQPCAAADSRRAMNNHFTAPGRVTMNNHKLKVFSGRANVPLAEKIANHLGDTLGRITLANFPDGEISVRIEEDVRGRDVYLIQPTCPPVNDNLMELLVMLDCFKRASAV